MQLAVTSFGIHIVWSTEMEQMILNYERENKDIKANPKYFEVYSALNLLVWLRVGMLIVYATIGAIICVYVMIAYAMGHRNTLQR